MKIVLVFEPMQSALHRASVRLTEVRCTGAECRALKENALHSTGALPNSPGFGALCRGAIISSKALRDAPRSRPSAGASVQSKRIRLAAPGFFCSAGEFLQKFKILGPKISKKARASEEYKKSAFRLAPGILLAYLSCQGNFNAHKLTFRAA